jgi:hypothetical protein
MHTHHLQTLDIIRRYDDYLGGLQNITLMGKDVAVLADWWSSVTRPDGSDYQFNIRAFTIDPADITYKSGLVWQISNGLDSGLIDQDLVYCDYNLAYELDTLAALQKCNSMLKKDGMLMLNMPYSLYVNTRTGRPKVDQRITSGVYQVFTLANLMLQLASSGFDCREAYFYLDRAEGFISAGVYKVSEPRLYGSIYELQEAQLLPACLDEIIKERGFFTETDLVTQWFDRSVQILSV